jgi:4-carboxymuconolactone decarboxylase
MSSHSTAAGSPRTDAARTTEELGGRLKLLSPSTLNASQRHLYDEMEQTVVPWARAAGFQAQIEDGRLIGPFNTALLRPKVTGPFLALQAAESEHTSLSERTRQVVILTVGAVWQAEYELYAHSAAARDTGISEEAIHILTAGGLPPQLSEEERLAHRVARKLVVDRRIDDGLYTEAERVFTTSGVLDIVILVGTYQTVCGLLNTFAVPAPRSGDERAARR